MKNKKILIIIPIILILLLIIGAGGFAALYFTTDLFKSPKTLFFKYAGQTFNLSEKIDYDQFLDDYKTVSKKSSKTTGEITVNVNTDVTEAKEVTDILNKSKITYNLSRIPNDNKSYISIGAKYDSKEFTRFEALASGDNYGIKCGDLYSKYIYIENNNLQALAKKFGINSSTIPNKIEKIDMYDLLYVNKDTRKKIQDTYYNLIDKKLDKKKFTTNKNVETSVNGENLKTTSYSIELTQRELYEIFISVLETFKNDDTSLDLIIEKAEKSGFKKFLEQSMNYSYNYYGSYNSTDTENVTFDKNYIKENIQELIDEVNDSLASCEDSNKINFTVYSYKGNTVKFEITVWTKSDSTSTTIELSRNKDSHNILSVNVAGSQILKAEYTKTKESLSGSATLNAESTTIPFEFDIITKKDYKKSYIKFTMSADDIDYSSSNKFIADDVVFEFNSELSGELGKDTNSNTTTVTLSSGNNSIKINSSEDTTFTDDINIEDLNTNNGICLNTASNTEIEKTFKAIALNFQKVLPNKLKSLGINIPELNTNNSTTSTTTNSSNSTTTNNEKNTTSNSANSTTTNKNTTTNTLTTTNTNTQTNTSTNTNSITNNSTTNLNTNNTNNSTSTTNKSTNTTTNTTTSTNTNSVLNNTNSTLNNILNNLSIF